MRRFKLVKNVTPVQKPKLNLNQMRIDKKLLAQLQHDIDTLGTVEEQLKPVMGTLKYANSLKERIKETMRQLNLAKADAVMFVAIRSPVAYEFLDLNAVKEYLDTHAGGHDRFLREGQRNFLEIYRK